MPKKQEDLPGCERESIPEIENAAEAYVKLRDKRMKLTEQEVAAKINLVQIVQANRDKLTPNGDGELVYRYDDEIVILKPGKDKVKVKAVQEDDDAGDGDED